MGGGVRDLLLGREPKDFDIATDASPDDVKSLFGNCRLIGRRFRLAHVHFGREIIEVATFRALHDGETDCGEGLQDEKGRIVRDNVYGTIEEDVQRRDFTVNALYYNIDDFSVIDYVGGVEDLNEGLIRIIGDPEQRYREDPVRMLRAIRFSAKLGFRIHPETEAPLFELSGLLDDIPSSRLFEEVLKLFLSGYGVQTFEVLRHYGLFGHLFPETEEALSREEDHFPHTLLIRALENTDARIAEGKSVTPAFLYAALLWEPLRERYALIRANEPDMDDNRVMQLAADEVTREQLRSTSVPKRFSLPMREIWFLQWRLEQRQGKRPARLLTHPRFRAAYDFLLLRRDAGEELSELCDWWTRFQSAGIEDQHGMASHNDRRPRRRSRRSQRQSKGAGTAPAD